MNFVTVINYHFYHLFLLQVQQIIRMSLFMKLEALFLPLLKIIYLSKVLTERFSILYKTQTKEDIRFYILTLVSVDKNYTFSA